MKSTTAICRKRSSTANRAIATLRTLPCSATTTRKCTRINRTSTCVTSAPRATTFTRRTSRTLTPTTRKPRRSNSCRWSGFSVRIVTLGECFGWWGRNLLQNVFLQGLSARSAQAHAPSLWNSTVRHLWAGMFERYDLEISQGSASQRRSDLLGVREGV
uniref:(northern house mosquito) hypothetical protein n=1 Tax=Culex pipiens TaxID=7175 RepID=A0A8D8AF06_CULPI